MHGPFDAHFLRDFFFDDERRLLFIDRGDEARLVFSLSIDFFNVEGMTVRGATTSCGIISLACLNPPPERRYRPENLYLAIIPGPPRTPPNSAKPLHSTSRQRLCTVLGKRHTPLSHRALRQSRLAQCGGCRSDGPPSRPPSFTACGS